MNERFYAYQCQDCDELHHPRHFLCRRCGGKLFESVRIEGECELLTWTRLYNLPEGFNESSITFGIVRYSNGLKVAGHLKVNQPKTGMKLYTTVGPIKTGLEKIEEGFIFTESDE